MQLSYKRISLEEEEEKEEEEEARFYGAPLWGGEAHEKEFRKIHEGGRRGRGKMAVASEMKRERETRLVLICHRISVPPSSVALFEF